MIREIPRFTQEQYVDISNIFSENNIPFETKPVQLWVSKVGGYHEYNFCVPDEYFSKAIDLLKEYFGFVEYDKMLFSGKCPACNYDVVNQSECPDCGLFFNPNPIAGWEEHPFYIFLKQNELY